MCDKCKLIPATNYNLRQIIKMVYKNVAFDDIKGVVKLQGNLYLQTSSKTSGKKKFFNKTFIN